MLPKIITSIPGEKSKLLSKELSLYESRNLTYISEDFPVFWEKAHEANVWDVDGNRFLDCTSGFGVASLGYTHPQIVDMMQEQSSILHHAMGDVHPPSLKAKLCKSLSELTFENWGVGKGKSILTNSGSEAVEASLKTAFLATGKEKVLAFKNSYHGLGYGSRTVTGRADFRLPFLSQLPSWAIFIDFPQEGCEGSLKKLETDLDHNLSSKEIGTIIVEPIQGRGGEIIPPLGFLQLLRQKANKYGVMLIFDEIYTGWWKTGTRFACDLEKIVPDILCTGKALSGGFPIAACVGREKIMDKAWQPSDGEALYTSTFLGNPLGCRMAITSLKIMEEGNCGKAVQELGELFLSGLKSLAKELPLFQNPRGRGLLLGIDVVTKEGKPYAQAAGKILTHLLRRGIFILTSSENHNTLSFAPPFCITEKEIEFVIEELRATSSAL